MDFEQAAELIEPPFGGREFNAVAKWLRGVSSEVRLAFLRPRFLLSSTAYRLAISTVNKSAEATELLRLGLDRIQSPNSTSTKAMVKFGVMKLGARRTIKELAARMESQPHVVDMAVYWLPTLISMEDPGWESFKELSQRAQTLGIIRPVRRLMGSDGKLEYGDRYADWKAGDDISAG
jgi:hypothetical protein